MGAGRDRCFVNHGFVHRPIIDDQLVVHEYPDAVIADGTKQKIAGG